MLKNGYKIILFKEGKYDLKQYNISSFHVILTVGLLLILISSLFLMFSTQFSNWTGAFEINKHRTNNQILIQNIDDHQKRIDVLEGELEKIKNQDEILRKLVKLPSIHDDIRKMGYGGLEDRKSSDKFNYLLSNLKPAF